MSRLPFFVRWPLSSNDVSGRIFTLRMCMNPMRFIAEYLCTSFGMSFLGEQPSEPVHRHIVFAGLSTIARYRSMFSSQVMTRGRPKIGYGGSSGCSAITTPHSSATGITRFKKYSMFCHSPSSPSSPYARMRSRTSSCV